MRTHAREFSDLSSEFVQHDHYKESANIIFWFNLFQIESFDSWVCYLAKPQEKKSVECHSREQRSVFQSYLSNWIQCYHKNNCAKYHFQIQMESFDTYLCYIGDLWTKKTLFNVPALAGNTEDYFEQFQAS